MTIGTRGLRARLLSASALILAGVAVDTGAYAQVEEIVVTARRREERLTDVPMSISAVTSEAITTRNVTDLTDIARLTPNFTTTQYVAQRVRRDQLTLVVRGVARGGTGVFINGAPASGGNSANIGDLERVEVLKGPQSAYFGRATFAGALNLVTKRPSTEGWGGSFDALAGSDNWTDFRASLEGPLFDTVSVRVSGRRYWQDGQYRSAYDGRKITNESTTSVTGVIDFHPSDAFNVTVVALHNRVLDGTPSNAKFSRPRGDFNCNSGVAPAGTVNYFCGRLPRYPENRVGSDYPLTPALRDVLFNNSRGFINLDQLDFLLDEPGETNRTTHVNLRADYTLGGGFLDGATLSYLGAYNYNHGSFIVNSYGESVQFLLGTPQSNPATRVNNGGLVNFPTFLISSNSASEDMSHEIRIASSQEQRLRWLAGVSYTQNFPILGWIYGVTTTGVVAFGAGNQATTNKTTGFFGSVAYDIIDDLTLTLEGRYQIDKTVLELRPANTLLQRAEDKKFLPRVSLQYNVTPDVNVYASFAIGRQPQSFNATLFQEPQSTLDLVRQQTGAGRIVQGERMDVYELGSKGTVFEGRLAYNAAVYFGKWKNQVIPQVVFVPNINNPAVPNILRPNTNGGLTDLKGFELESTAVLSDNITVSGALGYNELTIKRFNCGECETNLTGRSNITGNRLGGSSGGPAWTGQLFAEYRDSFGDEREWYLNTQFIYQGPMFADNANLASSIPRETFDFRAGIDWGSFTTEVFVLNAFEDYYYTVAHRDGDLAQTLYANNAGNAFNNSIIVGLPKKRQFGARILYRW